MTASASQSHQWPFPDSAWPDPPWQMAGRVVTAWFHAAPDALQRLAHGDFPPVPEGRNARLRFYDIEAVGLGGGKVPFREAVFAYKTTYGAIGGEISVHMWTDSFPYLSWGREVFGWPLVQAQIELEGGLWDLDLDRGSARVADVSLNVAEVRGELATSTEPPLWITPRRRVPAGPQEDEQRDVLGVRPVMLESGRRFECVGSVDVRSIVGEVKDVTVEVLDGARIEVGAEVEFLGDTRADL